MPTYVYETIPKKKGQKPRRFEYRQSMLEAPLTSDPETGLPVRRVITGGLEIPRGSSVTSSQSSSCCRPASGHGGGCGCC